MVDAGARALFSRDALVALPALTPAARIADAMRFALRPTPYAARHPWDAALLAALVVMLALNLAMNGAAIGLLEALDKATGLLPPPLPETRTPGTMALSAVIFAPVLEEALHRGWMNGRIAALRFAAFGFAATACLLAGLALPEQGQKLTLLLAVLIALTGLAQWLHTRARDTGVPQWFTRHFALLVWGGSLIFAAIHLGAYAPLAHPLGVLVVTPQLIGGVILCYVRTRLGLRAAMLHHAAYNAVMLALEARA